MFKVGDRVRVLPWCAAPSVLVGQETTIQEVGVLCRLSAIPGVSSTLIQFPARYLARADDVNEAVE